MLMYGVYGACHLSETLQVHMIHILTLTRTYWWNWRNPDSPGSAATSSILTPKPRQELFISLFSMAFCRDAPYRKSTEQLQLELRLLGASIFVDHRWSCWSSLCEFWGHHFAQRPLAECRLANYEGLQNLKLKTSVSLHPSSTPDPRKYSSGLAMALRLLHIPSHSNLKLPPFLAWASPFRPCASHFVCGTRLKSCSTDTPSQCRRWPRVASQMAQPELIRAAMRLQKCYKRVCDYKIYQNIITARYHVTSVWCISRCQR